jgi:hypothetical protein
MEPIIKWLMEGDTAIRWQVMRDILALPEKNWKSEKSKLTDSGWTKHFLSLQDARGTWGGGTYNPKWTSTVYTLLQLIDMGISRDCARAKLAAEIILNKDFGQPGTPDFLKHLQLCDLCVVGMVLEISVYFRIYDLRIEAFINHLLDYQMKDGGWNCNCKKRRGASHSSFHTTFNVLDGLRAYVECGHTRFRKEIETAESRALEFMLCHKLFISDKSNRIINKKFTSFSYPFRWHYDVLRGLDYFQHRDTHRDKRLNEAIELLLKKRRKDGTWPVQNCYPGKTFFEMEKIGGPSRWNTLRSLRVLRWWEK